MTAYLGADWLERPRDPAAEALAVTDPSASAVIVRIVSGAPDGEARFTARISDGAVAYEPGADGDADLTLTDTYANAVGQLTGDLDPNVAFMRGRTKVAGSTRVVLDLLAATKTEPYRALRSELLGLVEL